MCQVRYLKHIAVSPSSSSMCSLILICAQDPEWTLSPSARQGCPVWIPARRWRDGQVGAQPKRKSRPWPKRLPRNTRSRPIQEMIPVPELDSFRIKRKPQKKQKKFEEEAEPDSREDTLQKPDSDRGTEPTPAWKRLVEGRRETRRRRLCSMFLFHEPAPQGPDEAAVSPQPGLAAEMDKQLVPRSVA